MDKESRNHVKLHSSGQQGQFLWFIYCKHLPGEFMVSNYSFNPYYNVILFFLKIFKKEKKKPKKVLIRVKNKAN